MIAKPNKVAETMISFVFPFSLTKVRLLKIDFELDFYDTGLIGPIFGCPSVHSGTIYDKYHSLDLVNPIICILNVTLYLYVYAMSFLK